MDGARQGWVRRDKQVKKTDALGRRVLDDTGKQGGTRVEQKTRVKVDSIISREKDLSLALKTPSIRIETPVMGQSQLGIEVPNAKASPVTLRSVMERDEFKKLKGKADLPVALGKGRGGGTVGPGGRLKRPPYPPGIERPNPPGSARPAGIFSGTRRSSR